MILKGIIMCHLMHFFLAIPTIYGIIGVRFMHRVELSMADIQRILPRHMEIMRRLCIGESQRDIAFSLGMDESRLSVIVNSPLFQLELRKMQRRQEDRIALIHEKIIEGADKAITLHNQIIDGVVQMREGNEDISVIVPLAARQQSSTAVANLFLRLRKGSSLNPDDDGEGESYEERLEKEVTFKTTTVRKKKKSEEADALDAELDACHPDPLLLEAEEGDAMDALIEEEVTTGA